MYKQLQTVKCIICIINCNIVTYYILASCSVTTYLVYTATACEMY